MFPIKNQDGQVVSWVGRATGNQMPRYLTPGKEEAKNVKECLFGMELIADGGEVLVVSEGPLDAIRLDWVGREYGIRATCIFGSEPTDTQRYLLIDLSRKYEHVVAAMDPENLAGTLRTAWSLSSISVLPVPLQGTEDFGAMSDTRMHLWCQDLVSSLAKPV